MTLVTGGPLLAKALDQAEENIAAGRWVVTAPLIGPGKEDVQEAFAANLHPRDRRGEFIHSGVRHRDRPEPNAMTDADIAQILGHFSDTSGPAEGSWSRLDAGEVRARYTPPYSAEVAALHGWRDTQDYLKKLGLPDTNLEPVPQTPSEKAGPDFYRSVAQAVTDAVAMFPHLLGSKDSPLAGIRVMKEHDGAVDFLRSEGGEDGGPLVHVWGSTSTEEEIIHGTGIAEDEDGIKKGPQLIGIDPYSDVYSSSKNVTNFASPVTGSIYGRTMHEIGHAVADGFGLTSNGQSGLFEKAGVSPRDVGTLSPYGAGSAGEGWAEVFATLHAPHGMDDLGPGMADKLRHLQEVANAHSQRSWGGDIL